MSADGAAPDARLAAALLAVDPAGIGGVVLRAAPGPARERWLDYLCAIWPGQPTPRRAAPSITDHRLLGGVDLVATLGAGRPVAERGLLAEADGGIVLLAMAERLPAGTAARIAGVMDAGEVSVQRDGLNVQRPTRFAAIALDEGLSDDEQVPAGLAERCGPWLILPDVPDDEFDVELPDAAAIVAARARLPSVTLPPAMLEALCATALNLGIDSMRVAGLAARVACAAAALHERATVDADDAACAAQFVLAPRARRLPPSPDQAPPDDAEAPEPPDDGDARDEASEPPPDTPTESNQGPLPDQVLAAATAALPPGLLAQLQALQLLGGARTSSAGRAGAQKVGRQGRGRLCGARAGTPGGNARLSVIDTLRAAAPWQALRRRQQADAEPARVLIRREDFRVRQIKQRTQTTTIFVVDASGSAAAHRLAEAKGAVELLLADCYVRRDQVALIAFRGRKAELLLPPTRSLVRAKRRLSALPGGGGTPFADALDAARALADSVQRRGDLPIVIVLSDGQANVARDGSGGRARAAEDAQAAARQFAAQGCRTLFIDTAPRGSALAVGLAADMHARYLSLPQADARKLSGVINAAVRIRD